MLESAGINFWEKWRFEKNEVFHYPLVGTRGERKRGKRVGLGENYGFTSCLKKGW